MEHIPEAKKTKLRESDDVFLVGGKDLEMYQTKKRLERRGEDVIDKDLKWGAKIEDYADEIRELLEEGKTPVAIELAGADTVDGVTDIDHHGNKAARPASITQVMERIDKPMSFIDELIAANDSGYIPGMKAKFKENRSVLEARYGEKRFEQIEDKLINLIRRKDREMQGVTNEDEVAAEAAIAHLETTASGIKVARIPGNKASTVTDRLYSSWPDGRENLIVVCNTAQPSQQVNYFGRGDVCKAVKEHFSGWGGGIGYGNPDKNAFSGCETTVPDEVIEFITTSFTENARS